MPVMRSGVRVGAAAFALGLALAGPQAAGQAVAEDSEQNAPAASADSGDARGGASRGGRAVGQARPDTTDGPGPVRPEGVAQRDDGARPDGEARQPRGDAQFDDGARPGAAWAGGPSPADAATAVTVPDPAESRPVQQSRPTRQTEQTGRANRGRAPAARQAGARAQTAPTPALPASLVAASLSPAVPPTVEQQVSAARRTIEIAQASFLNSLAHFLDELPQNDVTRFLEGALLLVRQRFFNQGPRVTPSPQATADDGTVQGRIGAFDLEGDTLSYEVTGDPQHGSVEVDQSGNYVYTPGVTYLGSDAFTVRIAPASRSFNVLDLAGDGSREVTIAIGGSSVYDAPDIAVNLSDTSGRITIVRGLFDQFIGTVTLTDLTDDTRGVWLDTAGGYGGITVKELWQNYQAFKVRAAQSGATVDLHLAFTDADDTQKALVLNAVEVKVDAAGNYVFTGLVAPAREIEETDVDPWDVTGKAFKPLYDAFRATYNLEPGQLGKFATVDLDFTGADFYVDTITPLSYRQAGLYSQDSESRPGSIPPLSTAAPTTAALASSSDLVRAEATGALSPVTTALTVGQSVYIGRANGTVEVWTVGNPEKQVLIGLSGSGQPPWGKDANGPVAVTTLTEYDRVLRDEAGRPIASTFTGYIRGDVLTVTGLGPGSTVQVGSEIVGPDVIKGTIVTGFIPRTVTETDCADSACKAGSAAGGVEGSKGTYTVSKIQTVGADVSSPDAPAGIAFTQKTLSGDAIPAVAPAVLVGLSNGSIQMYSPSVSSAGIGTGGWTELHGFESDWGGVKAILPYAGGFVVGLDNGYVRQWIGPTNNDPSTWKNNWADLYRPGVTQAPRYDGLALPDTFKPSAAITTMMAFRDRPNICPGDSGQGACNGFLVGREDGSVLKFNEGARGFGMPGWQTLVDGSEKIGSGWNSPVVGIVEYKTLISGNTYLPSFAFALKNGFVGEWKWEPNNDGSKKYGVETLRRPGDWGSGNEIRAITQLDRGFAVGLATSSVQLRDAAGNKWIELHDNGWRGGSNDFRAAVTTLIPFSSDAVTGSDRQGVIAGLANGSIQAWTGAVSGSTAQNDWVQLHGTDWKSSVKVMAPAVGSAINLNGDAVTRDGLIIGLANGSVQQWSGSVTRGTPLGYISNGRSQPAVFTGSISGNTLTVTQLLSGNIENNTYVVGGPQNNTLLSNQGIVRCGTEQCTGTGGAGTYEVTPSQTWPAAGGTGTLTAGIGGSTLILSLPAAYLSTNGGLDPAGLVGQTVTGTNVAAGTKITKYLGTAGTVGLPVGQAKYEVSTFNLVGAGPLTISGLPKDGQRDWTQLEGVPANPAQGALGSVPSLSDFTCDSDWRCTQSGNLQQAVDFGKTLAAEGNTWSGSTSQFGTKAGVGSADDPIFGDFLMQPYPAGGTTYTLAFRKELSPEALNYTVGGGKSIDFKGSIRLSSMCTGGKTQCTILEVESVTTPGKLITDVKEGMVLGSTLGGALDPWWQGVEPGTTIGAQVTSGDEIFDSFYNQTSFYLDGYVPITTTRAMSAQVPPKLKVGIDVNPLAYGYVVVPDGFFPKFKPGQWSLGVLLATEIGPSISVQAKVDAPEKDLSLASIRSPGPLGFDSFILSAGAKLAAGATVNNLGDKGTVSAYAYAVPGMLFTYNTQGAQGQVKVAFNYYLDANASEFKSSTGVTAYASLTPYVKVLYGILIPPKVPLVGGWSLFSVSGGFENPITASLCVDAAGSCPKNSEEDGATASLTFGSSGALTFRAGLLDGITSALSYEKQIPLYQIASYTKVLA